MPVLVPGRAKSPFAVARALGARPAWFRRGDRRGITRGEGRPRKGRFAVHANRGDRIVVESTHVGQPRRQGDVVEIVSDEGGHEHYRVRWDDGHESTYFASSDCHIVASGETRSNWSMMPS